MIENNNPLSMAETQEYIEKGKDKVELLKFVKNFTKLKAKDAIKIRERLNDLGLMKIKPENISKIIDLMPEDKEDLSKIFSSSGIGLDEEETKKILETVNEFR